MTYSAALQSLEHALAIRIKLFGEDHESTADSSSGVVLQTVIYKGLYGIDRFFLKEIKKMLCF